METSKTSLIARLILSLVCLLSSPLAMAHTMWLETQPKGKLGTAHEVRLYFGEFSHGDKSPTSEWLSGMHTGRLSLIAPDGTSTPLSLEQSPEAWHTTFIPSTKGWYRIEYDYLRPEPWKGMQLHYQCVAWVGIGLEEDSMPPIAKSSFRSGFLFYPTTLEAPRGERVTLKVTHNDGTIARGTRFTVESSRIWSRSFLRYPQGQIKVTNMWRGDYLLHHVEQRKFTDEESQQAGGAKTLYSMLTYHFTY